MGIDKPSIGHQVRLYREARGWTRKALAHQVGCAVVTLQKVERDERRPSVELLHLLAQALQLPTEEAALLVAQLQPAAALVVDKPVPAALIGRATELQQIVSWLRTGQTRLLTLTGPGGVGKTTLASAAVTALADHFPDGTYTVELAPLHHPDLVLESLGRAVGVPADGDRPLLERLLAFLKSKALLLYLDNVEHLPNVAALCQQLLDGCKALIILATSREPLHVTGEQRLPVAPLALPRPALLAQNPLAAAVASPAVALFVQRAQAAKPAFALRAENAPAIAQLCIHLDGLPLAIELVAARSRLLSPTALLTRFVTATGQPRIGLLVQEQATLPGSQPARHRTLRETLDWSYHLLTPTEQRAFRRCALFAGGCTVAAAEALLPDAGVTAEEAALYAWDLLSSLLEKSLLYQRESNGETRFFMLETVREYAHEQLLRHDNQRCLAHRHAAYYAEVAQLCFDRIVEGVNVDLWLATATQEQPNFRRALAWALDQAEGEIALRMATALWRYWWIRGQWAEGRAWLEAALQCFDATTPAAQRLRARALRSVGGLCVTQGDARAARTYLEQSLALARTVDDAYVESLALSSLATLCCNEGDFVQAETLLLQSMVYDEQSNNARDLAVSYGMLGEIALYQAAYDKAEEYLRQAIQRQQARADEHSLMLSQLNLSDALVGQARYAAAQPYLAEGLRLARALGNPLAEATGLQQLAALHFTMAQPALAFPLLLAALHCAEVHGLHSITATLLRLLGEQMIKTGELVVGVRLLGGCKAVAQQGGITLSAQEQRRLTQALADAQANSDPNTIEAAYQAGQGTPHPVLLTEVRRLCRSEQPTATAATPPILPFVPDSI